ncbi:flagellar protein export ATPase FliI [Opitutales bacterium ASA1]|uniref:FliI/YscN family ATPase n=1 Tax=Congregicoccus parvus TaxID=3081749 RepID=UPI002B2E745A|nr:flagellar protein export ATPase FliI [Opitutales bacterium ASA1]
MILDTPDWVGELGRRLDHATTLERTGRVAQVAGLLIESDGPHVRLGDVCDIRSPRHDLSVLAEVVGFREHRVLLMPLGDMDGIHPGCEVRLGSQHNRIPAGESLLGRVIDGLGRPIDEKGPLGTGSGAALRRPPPNPLLRKRIRTTFATGVKAIDVFCPVGCGQRLGIFAGSGVGKSTLLGMLARGGQADVNVIALVGERGRELREFIEKDLGPEGLARSVIVVATSDQSAPVRMRAAYLATAIAESFRDRGSDVLFLLDSVTRFAMAQREIGLAVGEPPASRGYTPSVFSVLPRLLERTGTSETGSITAFYTVLVEGDDFNEPIADSVRGILDGHLVLSRALATANQFPAVDVLESVSRLGQDICTQDEWAITGEARDLLALFRRNEDLINLGAYNRGVNSRIDRAIDMQERLKAFLRQRPAELVARDVAFGGLGELLR